MRTCREVIDFLGQYVEGELPEAQRSEFERHLELCPPCVRYLDSYRDSIRLARDACAEAPTEAPPESLVRAILAARAKKD